MKCQPESDRSRHRIHFWIQLSALLFAVPVFAAATAMAQSNGVFVYPAKGQSQPQQQKDRSECHSWAVQQTGFDPTRASQAPVSAPPSPTTYQPTQRHVLRGGARGAALGAVGGAIAGDTGKGAAAGAAMGGLAGGFRRRDERRQQNAQQQAAQQQQAAHQSAQQDQSAAYKQAMSACLQGRGYTVN